MNTLFLLMAQYNGRPIIPVDTVRVDFFAHLSLEKFLRKTASGEIKLPIVRIEASQKSGRGVHLSDLAAYIDERRKAALKELAQMTGRPVAAALEGGAA